MSFELILTPTPYHLLPTIYSLPPLSITCLQGLINRCSDLLE
jgi:hypothetical protein